MATFESDAATLDDATDDVFTNVVTSAASNVTDIAEARKAKQSSIASKTTGSSTDSSTNSSTNRCTTGKKRNPSNRNIDYEKVAKLRAEIEAGTYKIDAARIADKFVEREGK